MHKDRIFIFYFLTFLFVFSPLFSNTDYFSSNEIGMALIKIEDYRKDEFPYILEIEYTASKKIKRLFLSGSEVKRWEYIYMKPLQKGRELIIEEREYDNKNLIFSRFYNEENKMIEENEYDDNRISQKQKYFYKNDFISYILSYDGEGKLNYRDDYYLTTRGTLRQIKRSWDDGRYRISSFIFSKEKLIQESHSNEDSLVVSKYDDSGKLYFWEQWKDNKLIRNLKYNFNENNEELLSTIEEDFITNETSLSKYNSEGKVINKSVSVSGNEIAVYDYTWDQRGNLIGEKRKTDEGREEWEYKYDHDDSLIEEKKYKKGIIETRIVYLNNDQYYKELFQRGELFIRIYYEDNKKYREEIIENGKVISIRDLAGEAG